MSIALISMRSDYLVDRLERRDSIDIEVYKIADEFNITPSSSNNFKLFAFAVSKNEVV